MKSSKIYIAVVAIAGSLFYTGCKKESIQVSVPASKFHVGTVSASRDSSGGENPPIPPKMN